MILAGFRKVSTPLDQLRKWWGLATAEERAIFWQELKAQPVAE